MSYHPGNFYSGELEDSTGHLLELLRLKIPFIFSKHGDGAIECIHGYGQRTCDGEYYSGALGLALQSAIRAQVESKRAVLGDWMTAAFEPGTQHTMYLPEWEALVDGHRCNFVHFETLLLRESHLLAQFYHHLREDKRRKVFMGPLELHKAAKWLNCSHHIITPMTSGAQFDSMQTLAGDLLHCGPFDILIYGAGMWGQVPVSWMWQRFPDRTYINTGSALDPLFWKQTRSQQLPRAVLERFFL